MLKPNGKVVLTVPAHMWLWCEEDEVSNHFKRYELDNLKKMLISEGFTISYATHFFLSIIPLLYIRTKSKASNNIKINPIINLALSIASNIENGDENWNSHSIDTSNNVNGKPIYYYKNSWFETF